MKTHSLLLPIMSILILSCEEESAKILPIQPVIKGIKIIDTAYLNTQYKIETNASNNYSECIVAEVSGKVNTSLLGTYYLNYDYTDTLGNKASTVTQTVYVIENKVNYLNGLYNVACSCTATSYDSEELKVTASNYTATVLPYSINNYFELKWLNTGYEKVTDVAKVSGNLISSGLSHYPDYVLSGTLSPTKNSFTIESVVNEISTCKKHVCKNVYTKLLIVN